LDCIGPIHDRSLSAIAMTLDVWHNTRQQQV